MLQLSNHINDCDSDFVLTHVTHCVYKKNREKLELLLFVSLNRQNICPSVSKTWTHYGGKIGHFAVEGTGVKQERNTKFIEHFG